MSTTFELDGFEMRARARERQREREREREKRGLSQGNEAIQVIIFF